jgi:hypothetical protein
VKQSSLGTEARQWLFLKVQKWDNVIIYGMNEHNQHNPHNHLTVS